MADLDITHEEANELIAMEKKFTGPEAVDYPGSGATLQMQFESLDGAGAFIWMCIVDVLF